MVPSPQRSQPQSFPRAFRPYLLTRERQRISMGSKAGVLCNLETHPYFGTKGRSPLALPHQAGRPTSCDCLPPSTTGLLLCFARCCSSKRQGLSGRNRQLLLKNGGASSPRWRCQQLPCQSEGLPLGPKGTRSACNKVLSPVPSTRALRKQGACVRAWNAVPGRGGETEVGGVGGASYHQRNMKVFIKRDKQPVEGPCELASQACPGRWPLCHNLASSRLMPTSPPTPTDRLLTGSSEPGLKCATQDRSDGASNIQMSYLLLSTFTVVSFTFQRLHFCKPL